MLPGAGGARWGPPLAEPAAGAATARLGAADRVRGTVRGTVRNGVAQYLGAAAQEMQRSIGVGGLGSILRCGN